MTKLNPFLTCLWLLLEFVVIFGLWYLLKIALDVSIWRYSGPVSLAIMLVLLFFYLRWRGHSFSWVGLVPLKSAKNWLLLLPQILLAMIAMGAIGAGLNFAGETLGLEFMKPDLAATENRFGDLAGNTSLYLTWLAIIWFAGPAEELFFRGFMIGQLRDIFGHSRWATALSIIIPAILFGAGHMYYQGLRGLIITGGVAVSLGILFVLYKRNIWPLAAAHAAINSLSFTAMYLQLDI
ncbi:MAG: CPBP family intramembrane metalloprotease [Alphaproteobacteria bacterium]|nr:CPBP family intramembrane metalloprotease [Alphaproteobacteria bacterium]